MESLRGNQFALGHRPLLHTHGGPLEGLLVQILQTLKVAPREKISLHCPEAALLARLSIGVTLFMAYEPESILFGEGLHLGYYHRIATGPLPSRQIGVVDNAYPSGVSPEHQCFMQEAFHPKAIEQPIKAQVAALGIAQVKQAGDHLDA